MPEQCAGLIFRAFFVYLASAAVRRRGNERIGKMRRFLTLVFLTAALAAGAAPAAAQQVKEVKRLPTCLDFADVYSRTVLGTAGFSPQEEQEMQNLASIMMGYVSALQDIYGNRLVGMTAADNEWSLLEKVARFCSQNPQLTFQRAVRSIPAVSQTIQALQDQEFKRCTNYIEQTKPTICSAYKQN